MVRKFFMLPACVLILGAVAKADKPVDFNRDIAPIITDKCFACHGPDAKHVKGDLRIDQRDSAVKLDKHGAAAIVAGHPEKSKLVERIYASDPDDIMPPPKAHKPLSDAEKATLKKWIEQGAVYEKHWAYVPPKETPAPTVKDAAWPANWIDNYVEARLDAEGLHPAPDADRATLIRRVSFDLTGLPPTLAQVDAFVNDKSPNAFEKVVDRLLASPHYGERMAIYWLDLVRYADTVGYHGDQPQSIYPYRDYIINALNANKPFDQFSTEQLAGDLLPNPTEDQIVATGYNRVLQTTHEGGLQLKEYRAIYQADRIRNFSQVWMGATMGCCQCHNHKYDPYTIKDFYSMGAFFADIDDEDHLRRQGSLNGLPTVRLPEMRVMTAELKAKAAELDQKIAAVQKEMDQFKATLASGQAKWEKEMLADIKGAKPQDYAWLDDGPLAGSKVRGGWKDVAADKGPVHSGKTSRLQTSGGLTQHIFEGINPAKLIVDDQAFYLWVYLDAKNPPKAVMIQFNDGTDWVHRAYWGENAITYGRDAKDVPSYHRAGDLPEAGKWVRLEVNAAKVGLNKGDAVSAVAFTQFGGSVYWDDMGVVSAAQLPPAIVEALRTPGDKRTKAQREALASYQLGQSADYAKLGAQIAVLQKERDGIEKRGPLTMYTRALKEPRVVRVLNRGNWMDESGEIVEPAIPQFMGHIRADDQRATRLDLAHWLFKPVAEGGVGEMTARVQANRFWYLLMGVGIARVLDDFGGQGEPPVYPELLDRLALEFMHSGWDVKHMMKLIVMSRAYRQSSVTPAQIAERDPDNRLYAHQSRPRLPAEMIRDNALAISGLLVDTIGGPSCKPYQPQGYYAHLNFPERKYQEDKDENQWRRGVYMHWQRQFLHPMLKAFDAPSREECTAMRPVSNTPTAALTMLNDPTFTEAARVFAARIVHEGGATDKAKIGWAFRMATSRTPQEREVALLSDLLTEHRSEFSADPSSAASLAQVGFTPAPKDIAAPELAAWTSVARALLNLNETITRN
ncbi:MAG: DUF1549 domain-containing protein [Planctomycetes bacterium]|nr:DUF1549 domain-containing protein [Planctomycetota bacterium]